jgi:hypothetical protein
MFHTRNLNWTPNLSKIRRIWEPWFYIYRGTTLWTVALKRPIFKRKKVFANLSLGLIYHSKALPQPPSRDTVPLSPQYIQDFEKCTGTGTPGMCYFHFTRRKWWDTRELRQNWRQRAHLLNIQMVQMVTGTNQYRHVKFDTVLEDIRNWTLKVNELT